MNHIEATDRMAAEKYLLGELDPEHREAFEEHFFSCEECAMDVRAGAAFMDGAKAIVQARQTPESSPARARVENTRRTEWFAWLRPSIAVPVMAMLLLVVGYQNLVQVPKMERSVAMLNAPEVLPSAYLASGSARGGEQKEVAARQGKPFLLLIDIPGKSAASYVAELYDAAGAKKLSLALPGDSAKDTVPLQIPSAGYAPGDYTLVVRSVDANGGDGVEVSRYAFQLRRP